MARDSRVATLPHRRSRRLCAMLSSADLSRPMLNCMMKLRHAPVATKALNRSLDNPLRESATLWRHPLLVLRTLPSIQAHVFRRAFPYAINNTDPWLQPHDCPAWRTSGAYSYHETSLLYISPLACNMQTPPDMHTMDMLQVPPFSDPLIENSHSNAADTTRTDRSHVIVSGSARLQRLVLTRPPVSHKQ